MPLHNALLCTLKDRLPVTGHRLKAIFENYSVDTRRLFRLWKNLFGGNNEAQQRMLLQLHALGKKPEDLLRDWVEVLYGELISDGADQKSRLRDLFDFDKLDIEIVVAVPPGRSAIAHAQVFNAFTQDPIRGDQVSLVSEPECLFRSWVQDNLTSEDYKV
jgi:hypothetical protein